MSSDSIEKLIMPKWGLSMTEGRLVEWLVEEGATLGAGQDVAEVETEKINGTVEAPAEGVLRRRVAQVGETIPVGAMLGVIAAESVPDARIDAFVDEFRATFVPEHDAQEEGSQTETIAGRRINYVSAGAGAETVLLLHGFGGDLNNWLFNVEPLTAGRAVYALDLPGHGGSTKDVGSGELGEFVDAMSGFIEAKELEAVHLVGHSLGGAVAIGLALAHPDTVASLALVASAGLGGEINRDYIEGFISARTRRELRPVIELLFADPGLVTRQLLDDVLKYKRLDGVEQALRTVAAKFFPQGGQAVDLAGRMGEASVPVLAIWGSEDRILPVEHARAMASNARVEILAGRGHSPHMEAAGEVNRLFADFLSGVRA